MSKLLFLIFAVFSAFAVQAQTNFDSLLTLWKNEKLHDTVSLSVLYQYTWTKQVNANPDSAFHLGQMQYNFAKGKGEIEMYFVTKP